MSAAATDQRSATSRLRARLRGLYAVTPDTADSAALVAFVRAAIDGGAAAVQYRNKTASAGLRQQQAGALAQTCRGRALFIVNDDPQLALRIGADGVHVGEDDAALADARAVVGPGALVGVSCYDDLARAERAVAQGADYVAFGSFFPSTVKPGARRADLGLLAAARRLGIPVVAIGGIDAVNAATLAAAGADAVAVISDLFARPDATAVTRAARALVAAMRPPGPASAAEPPGDRRAAPRSQGPHGGQRATRASGGVPSGTRPPGGEWREAPIGGGHTRPLVTIVTRTLGRPCLVEAAESVAAQTYRPLEWVVVDALGKGLEVAPAGDVPTRVVGCGERMLRAVAGNFAFGHCRGHWLANLDDDDLLQPDHVARLAATLAANPKCLVAYSDVETWDAPQHVLGRYAFDYSHLLLTSRNLFPPHAALFDARLVSDFGVRYDPQLDYFDDWDLWLQMARRTRFVRVPGASAIYRLYLSGSGVNKVDTGGAAPEAYAQRDLVLQRYAPDRERLTREFAVLRGRALAASQAGDWAVAAPVWREVVTLQPYDPDAITHFAEASLRANEVQPALDVLEVAVQLLPDEATVHWARAIVLDAQRQHDAATAARRRALELDPTLADQSALSQEDSR